jgi:hypothetical protein
VVAAAAVAVVLWLAACKRDDANSRTLFVVCLYSNRDVSFVSQRAALKGKGTVKICKLMDR